MLFYDSYLSYGSLALLVFLAGIVDSMAGGGGLITLPSYLNFGLPPSLLLGTNKLSSSLGTSVAAYKFLNELKFQKEYLFVLIIFSAAGAIAGAKAISLVPPEFLIYLLLVTLPPLAGFILIKKNFGLLDESDTFGQGELLARSSLIACALGFYDGLLGPGTGTFLAIAFARLCCYELVRATALAKLLNLTSNIAALITFIILGAVNIKLGLIMGVACMAGNYMGSRLALKHGAWIIRPVLVVVSAGLLIKVTLNLIY